MKSADEMIHRAIKILRTIGMAWCLFGACLAAICADTVRIVSQTVGTDELLIALAEPEQIAALSHLSRDSVYSAVAEEAKAYLQLESGDLETILKYRPTLVLGADFSRMELLQQVENAGVRVMRFTCYETLEDAYSNLRLLARELGPRAEFKAERIIESCEQRVAKLQQRLAGRERVRVIAPSTYGVIGGAGTTFQDLCNHAGAENLASTLGGLVGHEAPPIEQMLNWPIEQVVLAGESVSQALRPYEKLPPYPFIEAIKQRRVVLIEPYMLSSVSHHRIDGYEVLARALHPEAFAE
jgi:iron complex transport system substrate-binding protein